METIQINIPKQYTTTLEELIEVFSKLRIMEYTNWLVQQNILIVEHKNGTYFCSNVQGSSKRYTAEELYKCYAQGKTLK